MNVNFFRCDVRFASVKDAEFSGGGEVSVPGLGGRHLGEDGTQFRENFSFTFAISCDYDSAWLVEQTR